MEVAYLERTGASDAEAGGSMRLWRYSGISRLGLVGLGLWVVAVAVFTLTASFVRAQKQRGATPAPAGRLTGVAGPTLEGGLAWQAIQGRWTAAGGALVSEDGAGVLILQTDYLDYRYQAGVRADPGAPPELLFRWKDPSNYYAIALSSDYRLALSKVQGGTRVDGLAWVQLDAEPAEVRRFTVVAQGGRLLVWLDERLAIDYRDPEPLPSGGVGLATHGAKASLVDPSLQPLGSVD